VSSVNSVGVVGVDGVDGVVGVDVALIESKSIDVEVDTGVAGDISSCEDIFIFVSLLFCCCCCCGCCGCCCGCCCGFRNMSKIFPYFGLGSLPSFASIER